MSPADLCAIGGNFLSAVGDFPLYRLASSSPAAATALSTPTPPLHNAAPL
jgi:hypothetical protein